MKVMSMLDIDMSQTFFIEKNPERKNIRYCVQYVESSTEIIEIFDSVLNELIEKGENSSRRLIYSQTRNQCATMHSAHNWKIKFIKTLNPILGYDLLICFTVEHQKQ